MNGVKANYLLDTFSIERNVLFWTGFYPIPNHFDFIHYKIIHYISFLCGWGSTIWMTLSMLVLILLEYRDVSKIAETLLFIMTQSAYTFKLFCFTFYKYKFREIETLLNSKVFCVNSDLKKYVSSSRLILNIYCLSAGISVSSYFMIPIFDKEHPKRLVVPVYNFWDIYESDAKYYLEYMLQCLSIAYCATINSCIDTLFAMLTTVICGQFHILSQNLQNMDYRRDVDLVKADFKRNITLHTDILRVVALVEDTFSGLILVQCMSTIFVICFTAYEMSIISPLSSEFLHLVCYLACMLAQIAVYCFYGHNVIADSEVLGEALYLSNWYESDIKLRKYIIIFMERVKRPVVLTGGNFFPLSLLTFMKILKSSYSFFAFLQRPTNTE